MSTVSAVTSPETGAPRSVFAPVTSAVVDALPPGGTAAPAVPPKPIRRTQRRGDRKRAEGLVAGHGGVSASPSTRSAKANRGLTSVTSTVSVSPTSPSTKTV